MIEVWGSRRYLLHQVVADSLCAQVKASADQGQQISSPLEDVVQGGNQPNTRMPERPLVSPLPLQKLHLRMSRVSLFRPFKHFSSHALLISSILLLTILVIIAALPFFNLFSPHTSSHQEDYDTSAPPSYKLLIPSTAASLPANAQHLQNAFNAVYPQLVNRFALDRNTAPKIMILTLAHASGLSSAVSISGPTISVSPDWIEHSASDIGLLTYELTLSIEQYPSGAPAWFADGMANYARSVYGPADDDHWSLPNAVQPTDSYTQGGKVGARFLLWLEQHARLDIVDQLNHALQTRQSFSAVIQRLTHHTMDEQWNQYQKDPDITLTPDQLYRTVTSRKPLYRSASFSIQTSQPRTIALSDDLGRLFLSNFAIQADMTILSGDGGGFIFRNNTNAQYRLHITLDGTFDLVDQTNIGPNGFSPAIRKGLKQTNRVTIIAQQHLISVYINGQLILKVAGRSPSINGLPAGNMNGNPSNYGTVALMANDDNDPTEVHFENIEIF